MSSLILNIPHSSVVIPETFKSAFVISDEELRHELLVMTDWYTDEIFDHGFGRSITAPVSRLVCDTERFSHNDQESMSFIGMGYCYTHGSQNQVIKITDQAYSDEILWRYYAPHHIALTDAVEEALLKYGKALIIDCHSFSSKPLPYETARNPDRCDICIGTDSFHTPAWFQNYVYDFFTSYGFNVEFNNPYSGSIVPLRYYGKDKRVLSIMIEINRRLYINEADASKNNGFTKIREIIGILERLLCFHN